MTGVLARWPVFVATLTLVLFSLSGEALAQKHPPTLREFRLQYKGREVQIVDKTGWAEQFATCDPSKTYTLFLNDVQNDYIVVSRGTQTDKRTFIYPVAIIRRVIFQFDGKPYDKILIEMY